MSFSFSHALCFFSPLSDLHSFLCSSLLTLFAFFLITSVFLPITYFFHKPIWRFFGSLVIQTNEERKIKGVKKHGKINKGLPFTLSSLRECWMESSFFFRDPFPLRDPFKSTKTLLKSTKMSTYEVNLHSKTKKTPLMQTKNLFLAHKRLFRASQDVLLNGQTPILS